MKKVLFLALGLTCALSATQLFERCAVCHGKQGEKHSQNLTRSIAGLKADEISGILKEYRAGKRNAYGMGIMMQGQAQKLSDADIKELSEYVSSLPPVSEIVEKPKLTENMTTEEIFQRCGICHGDKGQKKSLGVSRRIAGMNAAEIIKDLHEYKAGTRSTYGYGEMMQGQATKLNDEQMKAVAALIAALPPVQTEADKNAADAKKQITQEEIEYNKFLEEFFRTSTNPNETFKEAKRKYEEHKKLKKEQQQNEQNSTGN